MHRRKEVIVAAHQFWEGYKVISNQFGVHHSNSKREIHKWKTFRTSPRVDGKFTPQSGCAILREITKKPESFISEAVKAWTKLGHEIGKLSQTQQLIYNRMTEKRKVSRYCNGLVKRAV
uniref:Uncharacterized protein n=1 Tax=Kryptolebias marmoratus TaxID=37003 RepID=A0A3Q2ZKK6_KRYMA